MALPDPLANPYAEPAASNDAPRISHNPLRPQADPSSGRRHGVSRRTTIVLALVAFLVGVGLIAYPYVSDYIHKLSQAQVVSTQEQVVSQQDTGKLEEERQKALDYNQRLLMSRSTVTDPFDPNAQRVTSDEYQSLMNLAGDGVMGTLVIPKINLTMPIYHGTNDEELQKGVGHLENTSLPYGGPSSHSVLAGHNGLPSVRIFDDLDKLEVGDWFILRALGEDHAYRVTGKETVLPDQTDSLMIQDGKDLVTLVTCTPYGINTHRLLVHAERTDVPAEWANRDKDQAPTNGPASVAETPLLPFTLVGLAVGLGVLVAWLLAKRRRERESAPVCSQVSGSRFVREVDNERVGSGKWAAPGPRDGRPGAPGAPGGAAARGASSHGPDEREAVGFTPALDAYKRGKHARGRGPRG